MPSRFRVSVRASVQTTAGLMPICQGIKIKHPLLNGFLPPALLEWHGDMLPVYRGKHHLFSLLGVFNEHQIKDFNSALFRREKIHPKINQSTLQKHSISLHPPNHHHFVNKGDSKVIHAFNSDPQCTLGVPFKQLFILSWNPLNLIRSTQIAEHITQTWTN